MAERDSILVVTSCTGLKAAGAGDPPLPAERLYTGEQHRRLMRGANAFRAAANGLQLDLRILSAGHGLVRGERRLRSYDTSFAGLRKGEMERRSEELGIPADLGRLLARPYRLIVLLLGEDYMRAAALGPGTRLGGPAIAFGGAGLARRLQGLPGLKVVPAGKREARRFSCGLVGLKGELGGRLLHLLAGRPELIPRLADPAVDVLPLLETDSQRSLPVAA